jgi:hypothetical protein
VLIIRTSLESLIPVKQTNVFLNRRNRTVRGIVGIWGSYQLQVVLALYLLSAIGRSASGATVIYTGMFFLPYAFTEILSHPTPKSVHMRHFKENCIACMGPPRFLRLQAIYGHTSAALIACWFSIILQHCGSSSLFLSLKK